MPTLQQSFLIVTALLLAFLAKHVPGVQVPAS